MLDFERVQLQAVAGQKMDVDVRFRGFTFAGPLAFVETLRELIPFDGFSDPPEVQVTPAGITAGFTMGLPNLSVGVFSLENLSLGAGFDVPVRRQAAQHLVQVLHAREPVAADRQPVRRRLLPRPHRRRRRPAGLRGRDRVRRRVLGRLRRRVRERLGDGRASTSRSRAPDFTLAGYFRLRGEVEALGIVSVSIELYLEMRYESASGEVRRHRDAQHRDRRGAVQRDDRDQLHEEVRRLRQRPDAGRAARRPARRDLGALERLLRGLRMTRRARALDGPAERHRPRTDACASRCTSRRACATTTAATRSASSASSRLSSHWPERRERAALRGRLRRRPLGRGRARGRRRSGALWTCCSRRRRASARTSSRTTRSATCTRCRCGRCCSSSSRPTARRARRAPTSRRSTTRSGRWRPSLPLATIPNRGHRLATRSTTSWPARRSHPNKPSDGQVVFEDVASSSAAGRRPGGAERVLPGLPLLPPAGEPAARPARRLRRAVARSRTTSSSTRCCRALADFPALLRRLGHRHRPRRRRRRPARCPRPASCASSRAATCPPSRPPARGRATTSTAVVRRPAAERVPHDRAASCA